MEAEAEVEVEAERSSGVARARTSCRLTPATIHVVAVSVAAERSSVPLLPSCSEAGDSDVIEVGGASTDPTPLSFTKGVGSPSFKNRSSCVPNGSGCQPSSPPTEPPGMRHAPAKCYLSVCRPTSSTPVKLHACQKASCSGGSVETYARTGKLAG